MKQSKNNTEEIKHFLPEKVTIGNVNKSTIPGFGPDKLNASRSVRGISGGGNAAIGYFTFNTTGNKTISGLGFKPNVVQFTYTDQISGMGNGAMSATYQWAYDINSKSQIQTECIYIRNSGGTAIGRAVFVSIDSGGFTINITLASSTIYVNRIAIG